MAFLPYPKEHVEDLRANVSPTADPEDYLFDDESGKVVKKSSGFKSAIIGALDAALPAAAGGVAGVATTVAAAPTGPAAPWLGLAAGAGVNAGAGALQRSMLKKFLPGVEREVEIAEASHPFYSAVGRVPTSVIAGGGSIIPSGLKQLAGGSLREAGKQMLKEEVPKAALQNVIVDAAMQAGHSAYNRGGLPSTDDISLSGLGTAAAMGLTGTKPGVLGGRIGAMGENLASRLPGRAAAATPAAPVVPPIQDLESMITKSGVVGSDRIKAVEDAINTHGLTGAKAKVLRRLIRPEDAVTPEAVKAAIESPEDIPDGPLKFISKLHKDNYITEDAPLTVDEAFTLLHGGKEKIDAFKSQRIGTATETNRAMREAEEARVAAEEAKKVTAQQAKAPTPEEAAALANTDLAALKAAPSSHPITKKIIQLREAGLSLTPEQVQNLAVEPDTMKALQMRAVPAAAQAGEARVAQRTAEEAAAAKAKADNTPDAGLEPVQAEAVNALKERQTQFAKQDKVANQMMKDAETLSDSSPYKAEAVQQARNFREALTVQRLKLANWAAGKGIGHLIEGPESMPDLRTITPRPVAEEAPAPTPPTAKAAEAEPAPAPAPVAPAPPAKAEAPAPPPTPVQKAKSYPLPPAAAKVETSAPKPVEPKPVEPVAEPVVEEPVVPKKLENDITFVPPKKRKSKLPGIEEGKTPLPEPVQNAIEDETVREQAAEHDVEEPTIEAKKKEVEDRIAAQMAEQQARLKAPKKPAVPEKPADEHAVRAKDFADRIDELSLDPETKKGSVKKLAGELKEAGLIDDVTHQDVLRTLADRDMGVQDGLDALPALFEDSMAQTLRENATKSTELAKSAEPPPLPGAKKKNGMRIERTKKRGEAGFVVNPAEGIVESAKKVANTGRDLIYHIRQLNPFVAKQLKQMPIEALRRSNKYQKRIDAVARTLSTADRQELSRIMRESKRTGEDMSEDASPHIRAAARELWQINKESGEEQIAEGPYINNSRPLEPKPFYSPEPVSVRVHEILRRPIGDPQREKLVEDFVLNHMEQNPGSSFQDAYEAMNNRIGATPYSGQISTTEFGPLRRREGDSLPESWTGDAIDAHTRYYEKWGRDMAFHNLVERDPDVATALGHTENGRGGTYPAQPSSPLVSLGREVIKDFVGATPSGTRGQNLLTSAITALQYSTPTHLLNYIRTPASMTAMFANPEKGHLILQGLAKSLTDAATRERAVDAGAYRVNAPSLNNITGAMEGAAAKLAHYATKYSGGDLFTRAQRTWAYSTGELMSQSMRGESYAAQKKFFDEHGPSNWEQLARDNPEELDQRIGAQFARHQGAYDFTDLPASLLKQSGGPLSVALRTERWSVGQMNRFRDHIIAPLSKGNAVPLVMSALAGAVTTEMADWVSQELFRGKPKQVTFNEYLGIDSPEKEKLLAAKLASIVPAGMLSNLATAGLRSAFERDKSGEVITSGPALEHAIGITKILKDFVSETGRNPERFTTLVGELGNQLLLANSQLATTYRRLNRPDTFARERRLYHNVLGEKPAESSGSMPTYFSPEERFNRALDIEDAAKELPYMTDGRPNVREQNPSEDIGFYKFMEQLHGPAAAQEAYRSDMARYILAQQKKGLAEAVPQAGTIKQLRQARFLSGQ